MNLRVLHSNAACVLREMVQCNKFNPRVGIQNVQDLYVDFCNDLKREVSRTIGNLYWSKWSGTCFVVCGVSHSPPKRVT